MLAVALALAASLSWALSDFVGGLKSRRLRLLTVLVISQLAGLTLVAVAVAVLGQSPPDGEHALYAVLAGAAGAVGIAALFRGMAIGAMAVVAPISALGAVIPVVVGVAQGERPSPVEYVGVALALAGAVLVSLEPRRLAEWRLAAGAAMGAVAALGFGAFFVGIDAAEEGGLAWTILLVRLASTALVVAAALVVRPSLRVGRSDWAPLLAVGALDMAANALFAAATARGYVSLVAVVASLYPVGVVALARVFLGERLTRPRLVGGAGALAGVALISAG
ncbi:MAG: EamA family transporter [Actinomycetota bacterium]|nr:EamA family transporter [Actinomycetota bacterium]